MLQSLLTAEQLHELVLTRAYVETRSNPTPSKITLRTINNEVPRVERALDQALRDLQADLQIWSTDLSPADTTFLVPDTNVLLHHPLQLDQIDWHAEFSSEVSRSTHLRVVIPLVVVDELDDAKRGKHRSRARATLKVFWDCLGDHINSKPLLHKTPRLQYGATVPGDVQIQLLMDPPGHTRLARADEELVDRTAVLQSFRDRPVQFLTYDTGAGFRARGAGLTAHRLTDESVS